MAHYNDVLAFLSAHEDEREAQMNRRTRLTTAELAAILAKYPGVPEEYLSYLAEIG